MGFFCIIQYYNFIKRRKKKLIILSCAFLVVLISWLARQQCLLCRMLQLKILVKVDPKSLLSNFFSEGMEIKKKKTNFFLTTKLLVMKSDHTTETKYF